MDNNKDKLPLGLMKQAVMKLSSFIEDVSEIKEDVNTNEEDREMFVEMMDMGSTMLAILINMVRKEMDEEEFLNEQIDMDLIEDYPVPFTQELDIFDTLV